MYLLIANCVIKYLCCFATKHLCKLNSIIAVAFLLALCICFVVVIVIVFFIVINTFQLKIDYCI